MNTTFNIYPTRGFLNTEYKIRANRTFNFIIEYNGVEIYRDAITEGELKSLPKFKSPGKYEVKSDIEEGRQEIKVEDALRLGSSELKNAYVFDDFPYIIFVMKDRIHFYDPSIETYIYTENYLCPNDIKHIANGKLLFSTEHSDGMSLSIFNTDKLCIEYSLEVGEIIAHSKDYKSLYVLDKCGSSISIVRTETLSVETEFNNKNSKTQDFYHVDNENGLLYVVEDTYIYAISIDSDYVQKIEMNDNVIGITNTGYLITYKCSQYEYIDLKSNSLEKGEFKYTPLITDFNINGFAIANPAWSNRFDGSKFREEYSILSEEFAQECREKIAKGDDSKNFSKKINFDHISQTVSFYPTKDGIYIIECLERIHENTMTYYKGSDRVSCPFYNYRERLVWISEKGYEASYSSGGNASPCLDDLVINNESAFFKASSSLYLMLRSGEVVSTFTNKSDAVDFLHSKVSPKPIIIDGSEISTFRIVCRSKSKLVCKNNNLYSYYELSPNSEWREIKTISFEEEKHTKAKMSFDGKYLVYSKGGNKYALYNIQDQKEETVLTGNFVDFDKTGNLLFMENANGRRVGGRELKIYNPITFQWEKSDAQYYSFISPDGKLYAKTGLKSRYFNKITKEEISREEFSKIKSEYDTYFGSQYTEEQKEEIENKRKSLVSKYLEYFESYSNENKRAKAWIDNIQKCTFPDFSAIFLQCKQFVVIGVVNAEQELEIELNTTLSFLNYVSFSYDNKYVGIVGKPGNNGYLKLIKINYNNTTNSLSLEREICDTEIARWATWICAFTKNGLFGTYDSAPDLYLIKQSDFEKFNQDNANDFSFIKNHFRIKGHSLLCFSPSGKLMALSNQGYEAKSLGGRGHVPSNDVYIYNTETSKMLSHWQDQGDRISYRNVANAGFSVDESKLMTVSVDGVIVVRNIKETVNNRGNNIPDYTLAKAS